MIKLVRYLSYILLFFVVVFATLPKTNIYYFAQQKLYNKYKIKFISKDIKQNITKLSLEENKIIFDGIKVANIDNILIKTYIAYNQIIPTIYKYIAFYILYNYGLNPVVKDLLHTLPTLSF